ncbi:MAG: sugar phosphate isomerase/epimerase family protein [Chloroflexota bacterium]
MRPGFALGYFTDNLILQPERRLEILPGESLTEENLKLIKAAGILDLEVGAFFDWKRPKNDLQALANMVRDMGMNVHSFHQSGFKTLLNTPDDPGYKASLDECIAQAEALAVFEPEIMVIHVATPTVPSDEIARDVLQRSGQSLDEFGQMCQQFGVKPAVENSPIANSISYNLRLIPYTTPDYVGLTIDAGHVHCTGHDAVTSIKQAGSRLIHLHIADNHGPEEGDVHLIPHEGTVDWAGVYNALIEIDYPGVFMYELVHRPGPEQVLQQVMASFNRMKADATT